MIRGHRVWLVRFFDAQASFGWIPKSRLDMLGEDDGMFDDHGFGLLDSSSSVQP